MMDITGKVFTDNYTMNIFTVVCCKRTTATGQSCQSVILCVKLFVRGHVSVCLCVFTSTLKNFFRKHEILYVIVYENRTDKLPAQGQNHHMLRTFHYFPQYKLSGPVCA